MSAAYDFSSGSNSRTRANKNHPWQRRLRLMPAACCCTLLASLTFAPTSADADTTAPQPVALPRVILNNDNTGWDFVYLRGRTPNGPVANRIRTLREASSQYETLGEVNAVDAQSMAVNISTSQFWAKSSLYTLEDHYRFLRSLAYYRDPSPAPDGYPGLVAGPMRSYLEAGGDPVADFISRPGKSVAQQKILSFRLNDHHYNWNYDLYRSRTKKDLIAAALTGRDPFCTKLEQNGAANVEANERWSQSAFTAMLTAFDTGKLDKLLDKRCIGEMCLSADEIAAQCSERSCVLRAGADDGQCDILTLDFSSPAVRKFKLMQMAELVQNYHPAIFEIDFDRFPQYFRPEISNAERIGIMNGFLKGVHSTLTKIEPELRIGLRVPSRRQHRENIGIDLESIDRNQSADYVTLAMPAQADQQIQYQLDPSRSHLKFYAEMFQTLRRLPPSMASYQGMARLKQAGYSLAAQDYPSDTRALATATHLAYSRHHVQGMAIFNSQYYALRYVMGDQSRSMPQPNAGISCLARPDNAAHNDQHYFLPSVHYRLEQSCNAASPQTSNCDLLPIPRTALIGSGRTLQMEMAEPAGGWNSGGLLRLTFFAYPNTSANDADYAAIAKALSIKVNGHDLATAPVGTEVPADPADGATANAYYRSMWWTAPVFNKLFKVDASELANGINKITLSLSQESGLQTPNFRIVNLEIFIGANNKERNCNAVQP
ncbi:hypothetical protein SAMN04488038_102248 [Solimonas aquatica]|uniref:Uncharacterized protein n=1 Tax=Solimonas aquatica TaxID=489703 RepID=A0A1H9BW83_9GAMM|nr:hypothetical protein [Solimonas aquatica]SEP93077.1 hypothetical protein SAMN04488038_102248 [Solimonas aquatica]